MKLSKTKTNWLLIKAVTGSAWDYATFAVLELTEKCIATLNKRLKIAESLKDDPDFFCLTYWDNPKGWYIIPDEFEDIIEAFTEGELSWSFLSLDSEDELNLIIIKDPVEAQRIDIYPEGAASFHVRSQITDMEYRTADFPIDKLINTTIMEKEFIFTITGLLTETNGVVSGPSNFLSIANDISAAMGEKFNRMAQVHFDDMTIFQRQEGSELTCHDILILACQYNNTLSVSLCVDLGDTILPVGIAFRSDPDITFTDGFRAESFVQKPSEAELTKLFEYIFEHPQVLDIKQKD